MQKSELRREYLGRRSNLNASEIREASCRIGHELLNLLDDLHCSPKWIHSFLPQKGRNEIDTFVILNMLLTRIPKPRFAVPVMEEGSFELLHAEWKENSPLKVNRYGIPEPALPLEPVSPELLDVILIPLVVFDRQGDRIGYGGGYYDRFLQRCVPSVLKIGLSFFEPVDAIAGVLPTDIRMDYCVTPGRIHSF